MTQAPADDDAKPLPEPDVGLDSPEAAVEEELDLVESSAPAIDLLTDDECPLCCG